MLRTLHSQLLAVIAASFTILFISPFALGQTAADVEKKIEKAGGSVVKNDNGEVEIIQFAEITDEVIESIDFGVFPKLWNLEIGAGKKGRVTDRSLLHIQKKCNSLRSLDLIYGAITGKALSALLKEKGGIRRLRLIGATINDDTLAGLNEGKNLTQLFLGNTKITDAGLKNLAKCEKISTLTIRDTKITDGGLEHLTHLPVIILSLIGTEVTDKGLLKLAAPKHLRSLHVDSTKVTKKGKEALEDLLPKLKIVIVD